MVPPTSVAPAVTTRLPTIMGRIPNLSDTGKKSLVGAHVVPKIKFSTPISEKAGRLSNIIKNTIPATAATEKKAEAVKTALAALSLADD